MTDDRLRTVTRVRHLKESFQEQAELRLANALSEVRQLEASVASLERQRRQVPAAVGLIRAGELQDRALYDDRLRHQLTSRKVALDEALGEAERHRHDLKSAYAETHRWTTLEGFHLDRILQERNRKAQAEADEAAVQRHSDRRREQ